MTALTFAKLEKHAQQYGVEGVMLAAVQAGWEKSDLMRLLTRLDAIEQQHRKERRKYATPAVKHRLTIEQRVNRLLGIEDTPSEPEPVKPTGTAPRRPRKVHGVGGGSDKGGGKPSDAKASKPARRSRRGKAA